MPDTGAPWNIPYVTSADLVSDWPADSLALANAIDAGLDAALLAGIGSNVVQTVKTDTFSTTSNSYVDVTGLAVTITPSSATSKVLVIAKVAAVATNPNRGGAIQIVGGNAGTFVGDASSTRVRAAASAMPGGTASNNYETREVPIVYLDSPATTSAVTYKVQVQVKIDSIYINRSAIDTGAASDAEAVRSASSIIAIEVAA